MSEASEAVNCERSEQEGEAVPLLGNDDGNQITETKEWQYGTTEALGSEARQ